MEFKELCPICSSPSYSAITQDFMLPFKGQVIIVASVDMFYCDGCNEATFTGEQAETLCRRFRELVQGT